MNAPSPEKRWSSKCRTTVCLPFNSSIPKKTTPLWTNSWRPIQNSRNWSQNPKPVLANHFSWATLANYQMYSSVVKYLHVGGLVAFGFDVSGDYLLVITHAGRGVFCTSSWHRVARDYQL